MKYRKKEYLLMINTLLESSEGISKKTKSDNKIDVLKAFQDIAYKIGTNIEEYHPDNSNIVPILEKYCEYLYQAGEYLNEINDFKRILKKSNKLLIDISNDIKYNIPDDKKEIVFFPYKASMWDCMESVWAETVKDDRFDTYVVPIPYYDREPNGALGELHYEGGDFPDYVPLTYWEDYNTEYRKPDVIYIHNPYDEHNTVTSVHPDFYSSELKNYTEMLVYIPYYVAAEDEDILSSFGLENITTNGILNSTYIVTQSEFTKNAFIKLIENFAETNNAIEIIPLLSQKFLPLGSPKFDKVMTLKEEDCSLPETWKHIIYKENGDKKKLVLYNTSIYKFLGNYSNILNKIRNLTEYFSKLDDYVLWWRPHPLLMATIKSMHPELLPEYKAIIKNIMDGNKAIYDNSSDLYRAIALTDAYYGDKNSIAELYKRTGKPVFISDVETTDIEITIDKLFSLQPVSPMEGYEMAGPRIHKAICEKIGMS